MMDTILVYAFGSLVIVMVTVFALLIVTATYAIIRQEVEDALKRRKNRGKKI